MKIRQLREKGMRRQWVGKISAAQMVFAAILFAGILAVSGGQAAEGGLLMATTTSTDNTGLLEYLMPSFTAATGIDITWTSTGTGKALKLGENCDVDVLLVHAPGAEKDFVAKGFGAHRREIMYNDFVLIGPPEDSAGIRGRSAVEALRAIRSSVSPFVSRGDNSGTNKMELALWKDAEVPAPEQEDWYRQSGQGMLATIIMAGELSGYTLTDRGTYIKYESDAGSKPPLVILVEGDRKLLNQHSVIPVDPGHCPNVKFHKAKAFSDWLAGAEAQKLIGEFKLLDKQLFTPNADR